MKTRVLLQGVGLFLIASATAFGQQPSDRRYQAGSVGADDQYVERYVLVTGSNIPRKIKVRRSGIGYGTDTADNVKIYGERDIKSSGRATTEDALATLDPSVSVRRH